MKGKNVYPEWVQEHRVRGTTVKKVGGTYYLYKRTSKRVPGKKYPQPVDTYIGIITPDGVIESKKKKLAITSVEVKEYGFSKAVWDSCPQDWKEAVGKDWEDKLACMIRMWSPESYLSKERDIRTAEELNFSFSSQAGMLKRRFFKAYGIEFEQMKKLMNIYLVYLEKEAVVSLISEEQRKLLETISVKMESK